MKSIVPLLICLFITVCVDFAKAHDNASDPEHSHHNAEVTGKKTYKVTTISDPPFVMTRSNSDSSEVAYVGLIPDMLAIIGQRLNIDFEISHVPDGRYGSIDRKGNWTGMMKELIDKTVDIAAAPLIITAMGQMTVDFSHPFMDAGVRILFKEPSGWNSVQTVFILLAPYSAEVWVIGFLMFVAVSVLFFFIGRYSPKECSRIYDEDGLTLNNSFFLSFSAFMLQGYHTVPRSVAARLLICFWWMFTLFFLVAYAANLAAFFLTKEPMRRTLPVTSFKDLAQGAVHFGAISGGSTINYFKYSEDTTDKMIWEYLSEHEDNLLPSMKDGIDRVRKENGNFAFIMEGPAAEYYSGQTPCDLMVVGESKTDREYGFACSKDYSICSRLSVVILEMKENNVLNLLKKKWFAGDCFSEVDEEYVFHGLPFFGKSHSSDIKVETGVTLKRFGAPIMFICVGIGLSIIALVAEIMMKRRTRNLPGHATLKNDELVTRDSA